MMGGVGGGVKEGKKCVFNPCHAEYPCPLPIFCQSDYLIQVVSINSHTE